jgi:hypothetical protein
MSGEYRSCSTNGIQISKDLTKRYHVHCNMCSKSEHIQTIVWNTDVSAMKTG